MVTNFKNEGNIPPHPIDAITSARDNFGPTS